MTYKALVCKINNIREHEKLNSLNVATVNGQQILIGKNIEPGTLGVFYGSDGCISDEHLSANGLYRKLIKVIDPGKSSCKVGDIMSHRALNNIKFCSTVEFEEIQGGGYFDKSGRVKVVKFQGIPSDGYWHPVEGYLDWAGKDAGLKLLEGDEISTINGKVLCEKYMTPATRRALARAHSKKNANVIEVGSNLAEHYDTGHIEKIWEHIEERSQLTFTEKVHGTSGRTGRVLANRKVGWFGKPSYVYVTGSRRVIKTVTESSNTSWLSKIKNLFHKSETKDSGFHKGTTFRKEVHDRIMNSGLHKGECLYYEIVGYDENGTSIMGSHDIKDSKLKKRFGKTMTYSYGCGPDLPYKVFVYRITQVNEDGVVSELDWYAVKRRCRELGMDHVPELHVEYYDGNFERLKALCIDLSSGLSELDDTHIKEGVCVRINDHFGDKAWKYKSWHFRDLEGIRKDDDAYVDPEEIA